MSDPLNVVSAGLGALKKIRRLFKDFDKKVVVASLTSAAVVASVAYFVFPLDNRPSSPPPKGESLGGLDLSKYCTSYGYDANDADFCSSRISLDEACVWQYQNPRAYARVESGPLSAKCLASPNELLGGIQDMSGYCGDTFSGSVEVQAHLSEDEWTCRTKIQKSNACDWQYQKDGLKARKEGGLWNCYDVSAH